MKKTKIIATVGPTCENEEVLDQMIDAGANIFRFNMKHGTTEWHSNAIKRAQKVADGKKFPLGIMIDLQGPEVRIDLKEDFIEVEKGEEITFTNSPDGDSKEIGVPEKGVLEYLEPGDIILIDDGFYEFVVSKTTKNKILAISQRGGKIGNRKGLNVPSHKLNMPALIDADLNNLDMGAKNEIDFVALSFTRTAEDIENLRLEMEKRNLDAHVIAKIENRSALQNLEEIITAADGVMVARGDLGIETPLEGIPHWQKKIIQKARELRTPVIVATQMMQSMVENPIPTRAEVTDVANAIFNGTDAVMLSNETAAGKYPVEAVRAMNKIIIYNEQDVDYSPLDIEAKDSSDLIMKAAVDILKNPGEVSFSAVLVFTKDGKTAKQVSSLRPRIPVFAISDKKEVIEKLTICYGIESYYSVFDKKTLERPNEIIADLRDKGFLEKGKKALLVQAQHWDLPEFSRALTIVKV